MPLYPDGIFYTLLIMVIFGTPAGLGMILFIFYVISEITGMVTKPFAFLFGKKEKEKKEEEKKEEEKKEEEKKEEEKKEEDEYENV